MRLSCRIRSSPPSLSVLPLRHIFRLLCLLPLALAAGSGAAEPGKVPAQGGILDGVNPTDYQPSNPIILFIIQLSIILVVCHALHWPLAKIRQPRVIAEVVGGIILGPSVMGRIPGFSHAIFPPASLTNLNLAANLGLILYLFLIGLETDVGFLLRNWRAATAVSTAGLVLPFGLGWALAWGIYNSFRAADENLKPISYPVYALFIGIAVAITAFPVLCRILTELKLLDSSVGVITLAAGVANDVVGWILLALSVALVNAGRGITALYILLCCVGFTTVLVWGAKPCLAWLLCRMGAIENDPSQSAISLILLLAFASAFFTGCIGVHPIFGSFLAGLIIPRENRFNIRVTEKLEDLIGAILLPLYFTLSGLNTNLGLLDSPTAWVYVFATTFVAFFSKVIGAALAARYFGLVWRESVTIGVLMSCKGLVELIVLNIGLQAGILSPRLFTIFVVMALLTTFCTTPLVSLLYPLRYQIKLAAWRRGEIDWNTGAPLAMTDMDENSRAKAMAERRIGRVLAYARLDSMHTLLNLISLFGGSQPVPEAAGSNAGSSSAETSPVPIMPSRKPVWVHGMRLLQLTDRDSSVMTVSQVADYSRHDSVLNTFRTIGQLQNLAVSGEVAIMNDARFAHALTRKAVDMSSDLLLVPWTETGYVQDAPILSSATVDERITLAYTFFVRTVLDARDRNVAIFFSRSEAVADNNNDFKTATPGSHRATDTEALSRRPSYGFIIDGMPTEMPLNALPAKPYHIFLAYFGNHDDDELALRLVVQLCAHSKATATIARVSESATASAAAGSSSTASSSPSPGAQLFEAARSWLSTEAADRVAFETVPGPADAEELLQLAGPDAPNPRAPRLVVVGRGSGAHLASGKLGRAPRDDVTACLGRAAACLLAGGVGADLLVVQAKQRPSSRAE